MESKDKGEISPEQLEELLRRVNRPAAPKEQTEALIGFGKHPQRLRNIAWMATPDNEDGTYSPVQSALAVQQDIRDTLQDILRQMKGRDQEPLAVRIVPDFRLPRPNVFVRVWRAIRG